MNDLALYFGIVILTLPLIAAYITIQGVEPQLVSNRFGSVSKGFIMFSPRMSNGIPSRRMNHLMGHSSNNGI